jgi:hypothetical protein
VDSLSAYGRARAKFIPKVACLRHGVSRRHEHLYMRLKRWRKAPAFNRMARVSIHAFRSIDEVPLEWCFQPAVKLDFRVDARGRNFR